MKARIYQPSKNAMQSGKAKTKRWKLEYEPAKPVYIEPLMGWTGGKDTKKQLNLWFPSQEVAVAYAVKHGIPYEILQTRTPKAPTRTYADNFAFNRVKTSN